MFLLILVGPCVELRQWACLFLAPRSSGEYGASVEWYWRDNTEWRGEKPVTSHIVPMWTALVANPGLLGEKSVFDLLSYDTVPQALSCPRPLLCSRDISTMMGNVSNKKELQKSSPSLHLRFLKVLLKKCLAFSKQDLFCRSLFLLPLGKDFVSIHDSNTG
jgi:hypothetical protein